MYITGKYIKPSNIISYVPPFTIIQPAGGTISEGTDYTFTVGVIGSPPFTYRWYKNNLPIGYGTDKDLPIFSATVNDDANYYCVISNNRYSIPSDTVKLNVLAAPVITRQPISINTNPSTTIFFDASATGSTPLIYNWYKENTLVFSSENNLFYVFNTQTTDLGNYYCVISNQVGSVTSNTVQLTLNTPLAVVTLPNNITLNPGQTLNTSLSCTGTTPITAQWRKDGVNAKPQTVYNTGLIPLLITNIQEINDGSYDCLLTNVVGTINSGTFLVHVNETLGFTTQPVSGTVNVGDSYTFTANASGSEPISYKWIKTNPYVDLGITGKTLTLNNILTTNEARYACVATNAVGSLTSLIVPLSVINPMGSTIKTSLVGLRDLDVDSNKNVYYISFSGGNSDCYKLTPSNVTTTYASALVNDAGYALQIDSVHIDDFDNIYIGYSDLITKNKSTILGKARSVIRAYAYNCGTNAIFGSPNTMSHYNNSIFFNYNYGYGLTLFEMTSSSTQHCLVSAGVLLNDGAAPYSQRSIAIDLSGNMYYSSPNSHIIMKYNINTKISTDFCGSSGLSGDVDGYQSSARFNKPLGLACDACGNVFVADNLNYKIKKITPDGNVTTVVGTGTKGTTDGAPLLMTLNGPTKIALDNSNAIYIADTNRIRKVVGIGCR
jgi:hypothetical protein